MSAVSIKSFVPAVGLCVGVLGVNPALAVPVPYAEDFDGDTVVNDSSGTTTNTTDLTYQTNSDIGGWNTSGGALELFANSGNTNGNGASNGVAWVEIDDDLNATGFTASTTIQFPSNGEWASTDSFIRLVVNGSGTTTFGNFDVFADGYQFVVSRGSSFGDDAFVQLWVDDTAVGSAVNIGKPSGTDLYLTFEGVIDGSGGLDLTGTLNDGSADFTVTHNVASADLETGAYAGYAYDMFTNNDLRVNFDNLSINAIPEPGSLALLGVGSVLVCARRRNA